MFSDFLNGFFIELALIMSVGAQNAFILRQGIRREHVAYAIVTCAIGESLLISIGVGGVGAIVSSNLTLVYILTACGAIFLCGFSLKSFYNAFKNTEKLVVNEGTKKATRMQVVGAGLAFALLNPHLLIDSTLMGALSVKYTPHQWIFGLGAISVPFIWYTILGSLGSTLAKPLNKPNTWRAINIFIGAICMFMAIQFATAVINKDMHSHSHNTLFFKDLINEAHDHDHSHDGHLHNDHDHSEHDHDDHMAVDNDSHDHSHDGHDHSHDEHAHDDHDHSEHDNHSH